jgi:outer membrane protein OmpA-like peptidoglycan-associated protein
MTHIKHITLASILALAACGPKTATPPAAPASPTTDEAPAASGERTPSTSFDVQDNRLVLPGPIVFSTGGSEIDESASEAALWHIHDYLVAKDYITLLRLEGHGDESGDDALNLSGDRALNVGRWLVAHGIDCKRLIAAAFGDSKPIADPSTPEGRARNRRIEVVNAELRGRAIGGMPTDGGAAAAVPVCD